jgi:hypothetical protein
VSDGSPDPSRGGSAQPPDARSCRAEGIPSSSLLSIPCAVLFGPGKRDMQGVRHEVVIVVVSRCGQRRHLPFGRQFPSGTGAAGHGAAGSSPHHRAASFGMARAEARPTRDSQPHGGRAPGTGGTTDSGEALGNVVRSNQRKRQNRWGQNGTGSRPGVRWSAGADAAAPAKRRDLTPRQHRRNGVSPEPPQTAHRGLRGPRTARPAYGTAGPGRGRQRRPSPQRADRGCECRSKSAAPCQSKSAALGFRGTDAASH